MMAATFALTDSTVVEVQRPDGDVREIAWGEYRDALTNPLWRDTFEQDLRSRGVTGCHEDLVRLSWGALAADRAARPKRHLPAHSRWHE